MDSPLDFVLDLYRVAQDAPVIEFPNLALGMLKSVCGFRAATWSEAQMTRDHVVDIFSVHLHNEPDEVRAKFSQLNRRHTRRLLMAVQQPGHASVLNDTTRYYNRHDEAPMRAYLKRYEHGHNVLITDRQQWLSLYRPDTEDGFGEQDAAIVDVLMPHLAEALRINRALAFQATAADLRQKRGRAYALVDHNGVFLHCVARFLDLLRQEWPDWREPRIPRSLLETLQSEKRAELAVGRVAISARKLGDAILLCAETVSPLEILSPRELSIAREFGFGKSHKLIARELDLAPATVRNLLQRAYRKLGIDNKAALARLLDLER